MPLSRIYARIVAERSRRLDRAQPHRLPVPVISVGNLTVGGTGKTPCVIELCRIAAELDPALAAPNAIAVLTRGYGRQSHGLVVVDEGSAWRQAGDEPILIKRVVPSAAAVVHADRRLAADFAVDRLGSRLLLMDDGFQYRRLARDADLVLLDGLAPLGNGLLLPAGPLRERPEALARATAIIGVGSEVEAAAAVARRFGKPFLQAVPRLVLPPQLETECAVPFFVLTSIARPERFHNMLLQMRLRAVGQVSFRDHHRFRQAEIEHVCRLAARAGARVILTTAKDSVRIPPGPYELPILACDVRLEFPDRAAIRAILERVVARRVQNS